MFRSARLCCGSRSIGVVLTGTLGDGAAGLQALKQCSGVTVVQDPTDATFSEMPENALRLAKPHHVVGLAAMPALLEKLVRQPAGEPAEVPEQVREEVAIARDGSVTMSHMNRIGRRSVLACPDLPWRSVGNRRGRPRSLPLPRWPCGYGRTAEHGVG